MANALMADADEAIPDEYRVELIDGVIYDLNMPTTIHQQLAFEISIKLREKMEL